MKRKLLLEYKVRKLEKLVNERATGSLPNYFYHGTTFKNVQSILDKGLVIGASASNHDLSDSSLIYITNSLDAAKAWARQASDGKSGGVVFSINSKFLNPEFLSYDRNAIMADNMFDDLDDDDVDQYINPDFNNLYYRDFTYSKNIPVEALKLIWQHDDNLQSKAEVLLKSKNFKEIIKNWDTLRDIELTHEFGSTTFSLKFAYVLRKELDENLSKSPSILKKIPVRILNELTGVGYTLEETVLSESMAYTDISDNLDILGDVAVALSEIDGLSDHNIELFFKKFLTVRKQSKMIDVLSTLPISFLMRAKPFIVKKLHKQLGI